MRFNPGGVIVSSPYIDFLIPAIDSPRTMRLALGSRNLTCLGKRFEMAKILNDGLLRISADERFPQRSLAFPYEIPAER